MQLNFTSAQVSMMIKAIGHYARVSTEVEFSQEDYLAIANPLLEYGKTKAPGYVEPWRTLPEKVGAALFDSTRDEISDDIKGQATIYLDDCGMQELTEIYGFQEDVVEHLCYADPTEITEHCKPEDDELEALVAMKMFTADWQPTMYAQRWLEEYIGVTIDFDKAKKFVEVD